ncbi:adenylate kinase [Suhomyces tanzawaensis NRRL Y-17324]|uniref:GTP:AMP phosphotransferase, mitochondrial n=1 Tax=Suhomyces tanzawaensis NRRL Y-17324 TaxID=984487 RepID=A0A1E4SP53_9ASCO|nr:adenylate kinase [Suhomyces tanzawaensis NRRL Y-17324]ODV81304.1 adenylate kinase [Suhomyces tanzawaensis NRRL Y-17324]
MRPLAHSGTRAIPSIRHQITRIRGQFSNSSNSSTISSSMSLTRPLRLLLLGAPGSGKGTQTSRLLAKFPSIHALSSGDILRSQVALGTQLGKEASQYINNGGLVPDTTMVSLITDQLKQSQWLNNHTSWTLDGFPRTAQQAVALDEVLDKSGVGINLVVELDVDQKVILDRIEARWIHAASNRIYNLDYNPPKVPFKDDVTGEPLVKRKDDTAEVFQKRLDTYNDQLRGLKAFYKEKGVLHTVAGNTSDIIYPKLEELILEKFS